MNRKIQLLILLVLLGTLTAAAQPLVGLSTRRHELGTILPVREAARAIRAARASSA